jgi:hypothetical protein
MRPRPIIPPGRAGLLVLAAATVPIVISRCKPLAKRVGEKMVEWGEKLQKEARKPDPQPEPAKAEEAVATATAVAEPVAAEPAEPPKPKPKAAAPKKAAAKPKTATKKSPPKSKT